MNPEDSCGKDRNSAGKSDKALSFRERLIQKSPSAKKYLDVIAVNE